ncbi:hypothetical protein MQC88_04735 [Luteimonas sp. 50]|uniref:Uncharacterized protein n=1 Tax=Cognatiluteimonas sedimenti TaxID=2927791 RepID=A0ABT0A2R5_9GAMM|nr:hypothetical protein [Lysobacter sedimenti]MCJ0825270.1 hypothetical protein [Lysobacter sedimenti]
MSGKLMRRSMLFCCLLGVGVAFAQKSAVPGPAIGYPDVGAALRDLRANPQAEELQHGSGWTWYFVPDADAGMAIWTFAPFSDPAYPAAIKRVLMMRDGALVMETRTMCQASLAACDAFFAATEADGKRLGEFLATNVIANAGELERERAKRRRFQEQVKEAARTTYGRP